MRAGKLKNRITIQSPSTEQDGYGAPVDGWSDVVTVWAEIRALSGKEFASSARGVSEVAASIRIRYRKGITAAMRVVHKDTIYNIKAVLPDEAKREYVDLAVGTGVNNG